MLITNIIHMKIHNAIDSIIIPNMKNITLETANKINPRELRFPRIIVAMSIRMFAIQSIPK